MSSQDEDYWICHDKVIHTAFRKQARLYNQVVDASPLARLPKDFEQQVHSRIPGLAAPLPLHPGGRRALFNSLMPILAAMAAVHTVLRREGWSVDQIGRLNYEAFRLRFDSIPPLIRRLSRILMVSGLFPRITDRNTRLMRESKQSDTFFLTYTYRRRPRPTSTMTCDQCGMLEYLKRVGLDEMFRYCNVFDFAQADSFGLGLIQPLCLGRGDGSCVYHFTRDPEDTQYPDSIRRILQTELEI